MTYGVEKAARLWQAILRTDTGKLFGEYAPRLLNRNWGDRIAQPGYVGAEYSGRLLFVSMNPGNGVDGLGQDDLKQYAKLKELCKAGPDELVSAFQQLNDVLAEITRHWNIYEKLIEPILTQTEIPITQIAYLTLLQWRTEPGVGLAPLYKRCWKAHTQAQIDLLKPRMTVVLGKGAGHAFESYVGPGFKFHTIRRHIGDRTVPPEGQATIKQIVAELREAAK